MTTHTNTAGPAPTTKRWGSAAVAAALVALTLALVAGGGAADGAVEGLSNPGALTRWGLPLAKVVLDGAAAVTIGFLGLAAVLPARNRQLQGDAVRALKIASTAALIWAAGTAVVHFLTLSDLVGQPLNLALRGEGFVSFTLSVAQGQSYAATFVLALVVAVTARLTVGHGGAIALPCIGLGAFVPIGLIGHSASGDYHHSATVALLAHILSMAVWVGGLVAVSWYAGIRGRELPRIARTFSSVALCCYVLIAVSGVMQAWVDLSAVTDLFTTRYGLIMVAKILVLITLGFVGNAHRRHTLKLMDSGKRTAFRRLAGGEVVLMAVAVGLAVALSRTAPPVPDDTTGFSAVRTLIGYPIPPEITPGRLITEIYPEALFAIICVAGAGLYLGGVWRLRQRGDRWPVGRTISWLSGLALLAFVQMSGLMTYGMVMLSTHMVQHMVMMMIVPVLLVLGGPITLALRAIKPAPRGKSGPREWIVVAVRSPVARVLTHPVVAFILFATGSFTVYLTGLFEAAMRNHYGHLVMSVHFLVVGYLFFEMLIGVDPLPKRPPFVARVLIQLLSMGIHAVFGLALTESAVLFAGSYYRELGAEISWLPDPLDDQLLAGQITMGFGEVPGLVVMAVIFVQWYRSDEREARRFDRHEGSAEAERAAYNEYLAALDTRARQDDRR